MALLLLVGDMANILEGLPSGAITASDVDADFPVENLVDRRASSPFRFGSAGANRQITADLQRVLNSNMSGNSGGNLTDWIEENTGSGDVTYAATGGKSSGPGMQLATGTGTASAYQDIVVRRGWRMNLSAGLKGTDSIPVRVRIQDLRTGKYLRGSDKTWQATVEDALTRTAASFPGTDDSLLGWTVEAMPSSRIRNALTKLRVRIICTSTSATVFADDVALWPSWDLVGVVGHTCDLAVTCEVRSSTDGFGSNDVLESTPAIVEPTFFSSLSMRDIRWLRVRFPGTPSEAFFVGELVAGQKLTLSKDPSIGLRLTSEQAQARQGDMVYLQEEVERRQFILPFQYLSDSQYQEAIDQVVRAAKHGAIPAFLVPDDADSKVALYGRWQNGFAVTLDAPGARSDADLEFAEMSLPTIG